MADCLRGSQRLFIVAIPGLAPAPAAACTCCRCCCRFSLICTQRSPILHVRSLQVARYTLHVASCCCCSLIVVVVVVAYAGDYKKAARQTCLATWPICMCRTRRGSKERGGESEKRQRGTLPQVLVTGIRYHKCDKRPMRRIFY